MRQTKRVVALFSLALIFATSCSTVESSGGKKAEVENAPVSTVSNKFVTAVTPINSSKGLQLSVKGSGKLQYTIFRLDSPRRLVIDMPNIDATAFTAPMNISNPLASQVKSHFFPKTGNSRIEILLKEPVLYKVSRITDGEILLDMRPYDLDYGSDRFIGPNEIEITGIELRESEGLARVVVSFKGDVAPKFEMVRRPEDKRVVLDLQNAKVRRANERLLTVTAKGSNVENVALFQFATKPSGIVKIMTNLHHFTSSNVWIRDGEVIFDIGSDAILATASSVAGRPVEISNDEVDRDALYAGELMSLDFQNASIDNILRIIADVSGLNIITSESVGGKVSMKLKDVPWDQALDIVLKNNGLGSVRTGNIIRVTTMEELKKEKQMAADDNKLGASAEALYLKVFQINYSSVDILKGNLDAIKSDRGNIDINTRTNTLIVQDTKERLVKMERLIEVLDRRTVQVLIEARIVEVVHSYTKEFGILWGGRFNKSTKLGFPSTIGLSGGAAGGITGTAPGSLINLPTVGAATSGIGITLGSINNTALLDMQLQAIEEHGKGKVISKPRIATMDNKEAIIESGREIPYQTTSADGTQTEFKKVALSLKVTPHVAQDDFIRLEIEANKDEPDFANQLPNSPPPLLTKKAKTEVLVKNGSTTVIGGLFKESNTNSKAAVPGLSKLPFIGGLFESSAKRSEGEELLIFITPRTF